MNAILVTNLPDDRFAALLDMLRGGQVIPAPAPIPIRPLPSASPSRRRQSTATAAYEVALLGVAWPVPSLAEALSTALARLHDVVPELFDRLAMTGGRTRPIVARTPETLYPGNPGLADEALPVGGGWWVGTNYGCRDVERIFAQVNEAARQVSGVDLGLRLART